MKIITEVAGNLQAPPLQLILDEESIASIMEDAQTHCEQAGIIPCDVTGIICEVGDGEYTVIWVTESASPHLITAEYTKIL